MTAIPGTNVAAPLAPFDTADTHPTHDAKYGKGGWRTAATVAEMQAIPTQRRTRGMCVRVTDDPAADNNAEWEWDGASWVVAPLRQRVEDLEDRADVLDAGVALNAEAISATSEALPYGDPSGLAWAVGDMDGSAALGVKENGVPVIAGADYQTTDRPIQGSDGLAWGVGDEGESVALGVKETGRVVIEGNDYPIEMHPYSGLIGGFDIVEGVLDADGRLARGLTADGREVVARADGTLADIPEVLDDLDALAVEVGQISAQIAEGNGSLEVIQATDAQPLAYTKPLGTRETIYLVDGEGETQFTDGTFDAYDPQVVRNSYVKYRSARDGLMRLWRATLDGLTTVRDSGGVIEHVIYYGQSNAMSKALPGGFTGGLAALPIAPFSVLMFNGGIAPNFTGNVNTWTSQAAQSAPIPAENMQYITALDRVGNDTRDFHAYGVSDPLYAAEGGVSLHSLHGVGGYGYDKLKKGQPPYQNIVSAISAGKRIATTLGMAYRVRAVNFYHGEADAQSATYQSDITQLVADIAADIVSTVGEQALPHWYITQIANWAYATTSLATALSPLAQLALHEAGTVTLVTPTYHILHDGLNGSLENDNIHYGARGSRGLDEKFAQALSVGPTWSPLRPIGISASGAVITVAFAGRTGNLQLNVYDATANPNAVVDPGNYGFELLNAGTVGIGSVAISADGTQVEITCSDIVPSGAELAYAYTGTPGTQSGPIDGPRGCLCDSDPLAPTDTLKNYRINGLGQSEAAASSPLVNWCVVFRKPITII